MSGPLDTICILTLPEQFLSAGKYLSESTISLSKTKLTVAAVSILLIAATGIGASDAAVVALNLVSYCINPLK